MGVARLSFCEDIVQVRFGVTHNLLEFIIRKRVGMVEVVYHVKADPPFRKEFNINFRQHERDGMPGKLICFFTFGNHPIRYGINGIFQRNMSVTDA